MDIGDLMNESNQLLAAAPVPKAFFKLAIPAVAAPLINILYNLVDKMFIGHTQCGVCVYILPCC